MMDEKQKQEPVLIETEGQVVESEEGRKTAVLEFVTEEETPFEG